MKRAVRLIMPGLVVQAVMVGGGYATGRELVEFFLSNGPRTALAGMIITGAIFSLTAMIAFELARRFQAYDYRSLCRLFLGRFWWTFEVGYFSGLLLALSVVSAAASNLLAGAFGLPSTAGLVAFILAVTALVFFGSAVLERVISFWSVLFYLAYGALFILVLMRFGGALRDAIDMVPLVAAKATTGALSYTGYNVVLIPIMIFVSRNLRSRGEALIAGALAGPLILLPGIAFLLSLSAFYPAIVDQALPVTMVLSELQNGWLQTVINLVILGALIKTGAGLLHGLNERIANRFSERGAEFRPIWRSAIAVSLTVFAASVASSFGLINLIRNGYGYSSVFFLLVFLLPLLTRGVWLLFKRPSVIRC